MARRGDAYARGVFNNLFVLELANNHWGSVARGLRIVRDFGTVARYNNVRAAIKLQFRDVDSFIHREYVTQIDDITFLCWAAIHIA